MTTERDHTRGGDEPLAANAPITVSNQQADSLSVREAVAREIDPVAFLPVSARASGRNGERNAHAARMKALAEADRRIALSAIPTPGGGEALDGLWPAGQFSVHDPDPTDDHGPIYLVCPSGLMVNFSADPSPGLDAARVRWIADNLNAALIAPAPMQAADRWSEFEDDLSDVIGDSIDYGWTSRDGAKAVVRWLNENTTQTLASPATPEGTSVVVPRDMGPNFSDSTLPPEMIEAGMAVFDRVEEDNRNYVAGETTDWDNGMIAVAVYRAMIAAVPAPSPSEGASFQSRVLPWLMECFGAEIAADQVERCDRFIEEALELAQSLDWPKERALALVDYVYGRPAGEPSQEVGGVMVTLAALCQAVGLDMDANGETELARIMQPHIVQKIRAKQAAKPTGSALPIAVASPSEGEVVGELDLDRIEAGGRWKLEPGAWDALLKLARRASRSGGEGR